MSEASTETVSVAAPNCNCASTLVSEEVCTSTLLATNSLNPFWETLTSYFPMGNCASTYEPVSLAVAEYSAPVARLFTLTAAPDTTAPSRL